MSNLTNSYATTPVNEQDANKVVTYNAALQILDSAINGRLAISTTGGTTTLTGTPAAPQAQNMFLDVSGTLTSNAIIEIPVAAGTGRNRIYVVKNGTSGAFTLTVRKVGGTGVTVTQGNTGFVFYNGTDIAYATPQIISSTGGLSFEGAWTAYTPTATPAIGSFTTLGTVTGRHKAIGKTCFFQVKVPITTNGSAGGAVDVTLPFTASAFQFQVTGEETQATANLLYGEISASGTVVRIRKYDGTYPGADGYTLVVSGVYEIA
jgi:hypothetical protein